MTIKQHVSAVSGFAYGVIGADIHVFGDGMPVYVLTNWQGQPETNPTWLRESPSRMLNARFAIVAFTGRDDDLAQLHHWKDDGPRLAVRWLHGAGGQGKTRLADKFASEVKAAGWKVITAIHSPGSVTAPPGSQDLRSDGAAGVLLIVDYADQWPLSHLTWLLRNALLHQPGVKSRVLLIGRSADNWPALRASLANLQVGTSMHFLTPLSDECGRAKMFGAARDSFAVHYEVADPGTIEPPSPLDIPEMGLTLSVHMAALVAVDSHVHGQRPPQGLSGLTIYLLDREHLRWATLYGDSTHELGSEKRTYTTQPDVMNQIVFAAALTGPRERPIGKSIVRKLELDGDPDHVLTDHAICYPPANSLGMVLEPLYPDRLAEDFLALSFPGHSAEYQPKQWAKNSTLTLIGRAPDGTPPVYLARALIFLAAAAAPGRWAHVFTHLNATLRADPDLAIEAGGAALAALAEAVDIGVLEAIEDHLPTDRHVDLDPAAAAISARLFLHRLVTFTTDADRARLHLTHGIRLANGARTEEALTVTIEAVEIYRRLAAAQPNDFEADLAKALSNLGAMFASIGRREEALTASQEAVEIYRRLAVERPSSAQAQASIADWLANLLRPEAKAPSQADLDDLMHRANTVPSSEDFEANLARSLSNLGVMLSNLGRREEALTRTREALVFHRRLAAAKPADFEPGLAAALINVGSTLTGLGHWEEALTTTGEALGIYRRLAATKPAAFEPDLATALTNFSSNLSQLGKRKEALDAVRDAVEIRRRLAEARPDAFEPDLVKSLTSLGVAFGSLGLWPEALGATSEAVEITRRLAKARPDVFEPDLARALTGLGAILGNLNQWPQASATTREAIVIFRRLVGARPEVFNPALAKALTDLGAILGNLHEWEEALQSTRDATIVLRNLATVSPDAFEPDLAKALVNLGALLGVFKRWTEALAATREAVEVHRRLAFTNPDAFGPGLARALWSYACVAEPIDQPQAISAAEEAVTRYKALAQTAPQAFTQYLDGARAILTRLRSV